ncbi:MAG: 50S ribosomal protein L21 [Phycisphaerales bacterium]|nr:MAG: 50S ribosomal protein L21 [Phycisphaerales bacterium]
MYAIIEDGGRQYRVSEGDTIEVDRRDLTEGQEELEFDRVLMVGNGEHSVVGQPVVAEAKVTARIEGEHKGEKLVVQHFRRRKNSRTRTGHRQKYLRVRIEKIVS